MKITSEKKNVTFLCDINLLKQVKSKCSQEGISFHELMVVLLDSYSKGTIQVKVKKTFEVTYVTNLLENE